MYGSEFRSPKELHCIFKFHQLWNRLTNIFKEGVDFTLEHLDTKSRKADLTEGSKRTFEIQ